jgi:Putative peptidoglycan binding domain
MAAATGSVLLASPASASTITSSFITSQPHAVQRACAARILAAQGPGAWTAWGGSLDNMMGESGDSDTAVNASSGAAGYYQIMPSTWADLCSDLGSSASVTTVAAPAVVTRTASVAAPAATRSTTAAATHHQAAAHSAGRGHYVFSGQVQRVQRLLINRGYSVGPEGADGKLGPHTLAGIRAFQHAHGLTVDGIPGPHTWNALVAG